MFCNGLRFLPFLVSLLEFARITLNLPKLNALYLNSAAVVYNCSRFDRSSVNGKLFIELLLLEIRSVVLSYVKISWDCDSRQ